MPKAIFQLIYKDLKEKIENEEYAFQELLPSESVLVDTYKCSRNTVRRAVAMLAQQGYVQSLHGVGVRVIYQSVKQTLFTIGGIESFKEFALRNGLKPVTKVVQFAEITVDKRIAHKTGFKEGDILYYIQRVRYTDGRALILDINMFLKDAVPGLTKEIATKSIYEYIENTLGMSIITSKRLMTVEHATEIDSKYMDLGNYNCLAVVSSQTYNSDGVMFEYTQSRHRPDHFCFQNTVIRQKPV